MRRCHPVTMRVVSPGNAACKSWADFMQRSASLSVYLKSSSNDIWLLLTLSSRNIGRCKSRQCFFSYCFLSISPCFSLHRNGYHRAGSSDPAGCLKPLNWLCSRQIPELPARTGGVLFWKTSFPGEHTLNETIFSPTWIFLGQTPPLGSNISCTAFSTTKIILDWLCLN